MTPSLCLIPVLAGTVLLLVRAGIREKWRQVYVFKPLSTLVVVAVASLSFLLPERNPTYAVGVLVGLTFSLAGDIALMFEEKRRFLLVGLGSFLVAHVAYAAVFGILGRVSAWDVLSVVLLTAIAVVVYRLLKPNLGTMRWPVLAYIVAISVMVSLAISTLRSSAFTLMQAALVASGAVLFYLSDAILALCRFWRPWRYRRISLVFYYAGQLLIALAASLFGPAV
jgi:uncharacterized membrane protein YhhN